MRAWGRILRGIAPSMSIEITRECPLRCPGCYAYEDAHLGGGPNLRQLSDFKGQDLIDRTLELVDRHRPLHLSIVGGDPLVRYRELEVLLPQLLARGIHVQVVTSAFRPIPETWASWRRLDTAVSIDGLQPEHDARRKPATYDRILKNIRGARITVHCTVTGQMAKRAGYLAEFLAFWSARPEVQRIWFSLFTPQRGEVLDEVLSPEERASVIAQLVELRRRYRKLDMGERMLQEFNRPPASPDDCIFAQTTKTISADLRTVVTPCQFGGDPDCAQCGCFASMGIASVGRFRVGGLIEAGALFRASNRIGRAMSARREKERSPQPASPFPILD
jgi:MoaA/NifB/PqqE/SkfB family radical SAM enzyme